MRNLFVLFIALLGFVSCSETDTFTSTPSIYVDPFIGSGGHGHVFVGASAPFGAVQVGPSNFHKGWGRCSGYNYRDSVIIGFSQSHFLFMPYMGDVKLSKGIETERFSSYSSLFSHENETASPGYYAVLLDDYNIKVELTASERVGFHTYHFPEGDNARIIIDLKDGINDRSTDTYIEQIDSHTFSGYRTSSGWAKYQMVYFAVKSDISITDFAVYDDFNLLEGLSGRGEAIKGLISFSESPGEVSLKVGISPVSMENALANIEAEIPHWDFEKVRTETRRKWDNELSKIKIQTTDESLRTIFYTAMYHAIMHPSLYNLLYTERSSDFINSMLDVYDRTGKLPIRHLMDCDTGTMVGINSFQVISEAYLKGIKGFDAEKAFHAMATVATCDTLGLDYHKNFEPIPSDAGIYRPVARALEYSIGDAGIALMAKKMGKTDDYNYFRKRAANYKLYYDKETGFIHLWLVPQDVYGLMELMGGEESFVHRLDTFFVSENNPEDPDIPENQTGTIGQYAHGNESSHHIAYLYIYAGRQWKTAEKVRYILTKFYSDRPDGIIGNEDSGQMSAWYIFSAMGFYPVWPASGEYVIGTPLFDNVKIALENGKTFTVEAVNNSPENIYVQAAELNGKPYSHSFIRHEDIINGAKLRLYMGNNPDYSYGSHPEDRPSSGL